MGYHWPLALDSSYVVKGANGGALSWKEKDWIGHAGLLVAHVDLWMEGLDLLSCIGPRVSIFHIRSHINLAGNDQADKLANQGRLKSKHYDRGILTSRLRKRPMNTT